LISFDFIMSCFLAGHVIDCLRWASDPLTNEFLSRIYDSEDSVNADSFCAVNILHISLLCPFHQRQWDYDLPCLRNQVHGGVDERA
jgi:hypothetical protein